MRLPPLLSHAMTTMLRTFRDSMHSPHGISGTSESSTTPRYHREDRRGRSPNAHHDAKASPLRFPVSWNSPGHPPRGEDTIVL